MAMNQKWVFLKALIVTLIVFNLGVFMGYMMETSRVSKINDFFIESEMNLLDQRIQSDALELIDLNCDLLIEKNIGFANRIFEEALKIEKYENANKINSEIVILHRKYDLLRTLFWINSIKIKEKCNSDYFNVVYFYQYHDPEINTKSLQNVFSNKLQEIKAEHGDNVMLIPISGDNNLDSVDLLLDKYNIDIFPTILINEEFKIHNINELEEIEKYFK